MKLDYIYHSGFAIEADGVTVIIDYYKDSSEEVFNKGIVHDYLLEKPGVLYVLCSHFHPDHFNREVLSWKKLRPDTSAAAPARPNRRAARTMSSSGRPHTAATCAGV